MKSTNNFSPWLWLALALAGYIVLLSFAYTKFRPQRAAATDTVSIARQADIVTPPELGATADAALTTPLVATATPNRASLSFPVENGVLKSQDGWVNLTGHISELRYPEYLFVVVESNAEGRSVLYLQEAIRPDADGSFSVPVKYGTPGNIYTTFVIGTQDADAALRLRALGPFANVPPEFDVLSEKSVHLVE